MTNRIDKISDLVRRELAVLLQQARDPRFHGVTVTWVKIVPDLSQAKIYVSMYDDNANDNVKDNDNESVDTMLAALNRAAGFFRKQLAATVQLRRTPALKFYFDTRLKESMAIDRLLNSIQVPAVPPHD